MNIFRSLAFRTLVAGLLFSLAAFLFGCEVDSTSGVPSDNEGTTYNFAGLYLHPDAADGTNGPLPIVYPYEGSSRPSGQLITSLRLLQYGSSLEAYDSANQIWSGSISSIQGGSASFTLNGRTTVGTAVEVVGTMTYASQESTMNAAWIEPAYYGTLYAKASVPPANTNNSPSPDPDDDDVTISPTFDTLTVSDPTQEFRADGGNGTYRWTHNSSVGTLSATSGSSIIYTRTGVGTDTLTVTSDGKSASASIVCE